MTSKLHDLSCDEFTTSLKTCCSWVAKLTTSTLSWTLEMSRWWSRLLSWIDHVWLISNTAWTRVTCWLSSAHFRKHSWNRNLLFLSRAKAALTRTIVSTSESSCSSDALRRVSQRMQSTLAMQSSVNTWWLSMSIWVVCFEIMFTRSIIDQRWPHFFRDKCDNNLDCQRSILWMWCTTS